MEIIEAFNTIEKTSRGDINVSNLENQQETSSDGSTLIAAPHHDDPKNWSAKKKTMILIIISFASMISPMTSTIYYPAVVDIRKNFETTEFIINISISVFIFITGAAPLFIGAFSDVYGNRRHLYLISLLLFVVPSIICALVKNILVLIVMRAIQACGSSATQCLGAGVISDMYIPTERGRAYGILYLGFYVGDLGGPIIGGFLTENLGFTWIFWFLTIIGCVLLPIIFFFLPETFRQNNTSQSVISSHTSLKQTFKKFNPLTPMKLLLLPNVTLKIMYMSTIWSFMYIQNIIIPTFYDIYNLSYVAIGLIFLAPGIGYIIGSVVGGAFSDFVLARYELKHNGYSYPEVRLNSIWFGVILVPLSYCAFGWMIEYKISLILPIISMFIGGFGTLFVGNSTITYFVDSYPELSASAIALSEFIPCTMAAIYIAITVPLRDAIGNGWLFTSLALINLLSIIFIVLVYCKGKSWREKQNKIIF